MRSLGEPVGVSAKSVLLRHSGALIAYAAVFAALLLPKLLPIQAGRFLANSPADGAIFLWSLGWWPHALAHGHLLPYTHALFAPGGTNLAWTTSVPTASLLMWPVTRAFGVFASFNTLSVLAPTTAAWITYLLVHRVTRRWLSALVAGLLFALSPLEATQLAIGHLNLSLIALIPLAVYLVVRRLEGSLSPRTFVVMIGLTLAAELGISTEVFATSALFGAIALVLVYALDRERRPSIRQCALHVAGGYVVACVLAGPMLYAAFALPHPSGLASTGPSVSPMSGVRTYLRLTPANPHAGLVGATGRSSFLVAALALPLLALGLHLAWQKRHEPVVRALFITAMLALILSAGIVVIGSRDLPTPWVLADHVPFLRLVRPQRLTMYVWLIASVGVGLWLSAREWSWRRWAAGALALATLVPAFLVGAWTSTIPTPGFVTEKGSPLRAGTNVAVVAGPGSVSSKLNDLAFPTVWQIQSNFSFRLANAYVGSFPPTLPAAVRRFQFGVPLLPGDDAVVISWLRHQQVAVVLLMRPTPASVRPVQALLGTEPVPAGSVVLFFVPHQLG